MKTKKFLSRLMLGISALFVTSFFSSLNANLDTTTGANLNQTLYIENTYTFTNFELARGFVRFKKGFTLPPGGTVFIDVHEPIEGPIDLNGGTLFVKDNLRLDATPGIGFTVPPGVVITANGGQILLNGYTLFLEAKLNLVDDLRIFNGTIDGQGHQIDFDPVGRLINDRPASFDLMRYHNVGFFAVHDDALQFPGYALGDGQVHLRNVTFDGFGGSNSANIFAAFLLITGDVTIRSDTRTFTFNLLEGTNNDLVFDFGAHLLIDTNTRLNYGGGDPDFFGGPASSWEFRNCFMDMSSHQFLPRLFRGIGGGSVVIDGVVQWSASGGLQGIQLGNGTTSGEMDLILKPGAVLEIASFNVLSPTTTFTTMQLIYAGVH